MRSLMLLLPLALAACTTTAAMRDARPLPPPGPDESKIVVYRTAVFGGADNYPVYDGDGTLLGYTETDCYFEVLRPPGRQRLFALGEGEAIVDADLAPGKTYYVRAYSKFGVLYSRPGLAPVGRMSDHSAELDQVPFLRCRELDPSKKADPKPALAGKADPKPLLPEDGREEVPTQPAK